MNLDDLAIYAACDGQDMYAQIEALPDQLWAGWQLGQSLSLPEWTGIRQVLFAGMGGSAIGADLMATYIQRKCQIPLWIHRDYGLPSWARGPETLVVVSSYSGNTEEAISSFEQALTSGCSCLVISKDGALGRLAQERAIPWWKFEHQGQPRSAVGISFALLLALFVRLKLIANPHAELEDVLNAIRQQAVMLKRDIPVSSNPAKRMAGQMIDRSVVIFGSGILAPVARRWKTQINEVSKSMAQFEFLPEADHNTLAGTSYPEELITRTMAIFLYAPSDATRQHQRSDLTRQAFMVQGFNTDIFEASGNRPLSHLWTSLHFGDYVAYYLAIAYQVDPTPIPAIESFKEEMRLNLDWERNC